MKNVVVFGLLLALCFLMWQAGDTSCPLVLNLECECPRRVEVFCSDAPVTRIPRMMDWAYHHLQTLTLQRHSIHHLYDADLVSFLELKQLDVHASIDGTCVMDERQNTATVTVYGLCPPVSLLPRLLLSNSLYFLH